MSKIDELMLKAEQGDKNAQFNLGWMCLTAKDGVKQDVPAGIKYMEMAAAQGDIDAATCLANVYDDFSIDANKAMYWSKKAAMMSTTGEEIVDYAFKFIEGRLVVQNYATAKEWLNKAASMGNARAKEYLKNLKY